MRSDWPRYDEDTSTGVERERETERNGDGDRYDGIVPGAQCAARVVLARLPTDVIGN